jgi:hypothetical protein
MPAAEAVCIATESYCAAGVAVCCYKERRFCSLVLKCSCLWTTTPLAAAAADALRTHGSITLQPAARQEARLAAVLKLWTVA